MRGRKKRGMDPEEFGSERYAEELGVSSKKRKRRLPFEIPRWIFRVAFILIACVVFLLVWFNRDNLSPDRVVEWFQDTVLGFGTGEGYPTPISGTNVSAGNFDVSNGQVVLTSDTEAVILNQNGKTVMSRQHSYSQPVMKAKDGRVLLYNLGGTGFQIESRSATIYKGNLEQNIYAGDVAANGIYAMVSKSKGYLGQLTVYLKDNSEQYKYFFSEYYITSIALNKDGTGAVAAGVSAKDGALRSAVYVFSFDKAEPAAVFEYDENLIQSVGYLKDGTAVAVGDSLTSVINTSAGTKIDYSYGTQHLSAYRICDTGTVLALSQYTDGRSCTLVQLDNKGGAAATISTDLKITSVSGYGQTLAALSGGRVHVYDEKGAKKGDWDAGSDARELLLSNDRTAYILGITEVRLVNMG